MDPQVCRSRIAEVVTSRIVVLGVVCMLGAALAGSARPSASRGMCGPTLCFPGERGWYRSVGHGVVNARPAAWLLVGNFPVQADAARHEASPSVPRGKVLISLGDFPVVRPYNRWRRVARLRLPRGTTAKRVVSWHVRFAGRAVFLTVTFGSAPNPQMRNLANAKLMAIYRKQR